MKTITSIIHLLPTNSNIELSKIVKDDWCIDTENNTITRARFYDQYNFQKIIATTNKNLSLPSFDDFFLLTISCIILILIFLLNILY